MYRLGERFGEDEGVVDTTGNIGGLRGKREGHRVGLSVLHITPLGGRGTTKTEGSQPAPGGTPGPKEAAPRTSDEVVQAWNEVH